VCDFISYAKRAGLDPETVLESIGQGAAASWNLNNLRPNLLLETASWILKFMR
jgi:3-hydroxyisobutyrate dehydrogenase